MANKDILVYMHEFSFLRKDVEFAAVNIRFVEDRKYFICDVYYRNIKSNTSIHEFRSAKKFLSKDNLTVWINELTSLSKKNERCTINYIVLGRNTHNFQYVNWNMLPKIGVIKENSLYTKKRVTSTNIRDEKSNESIAAVRLMLPTYTLSGIDEPVGFNLTSVDSNTPDEYLDLIFGAIGAQYLTYKEAEKQYNTMMNCLDENTKLLYETIR